MQSAEDNAVVALARALADQLRQEKLRSKEAELRASAARTAEVKAKRELGKQRAGWKQRKKKWLSYKVKHEALKAKYTRLKAIMYKEQTARATRPATPSIPGAAPAAQPRHPNGGSTPQSQPTRKTPSARKPAAVKNPVADPSLKVTAKVAGSLEPSSSADLPPDSSEDIGLPPTATSGAAPSGGRGERCMRSSVASSSVVDPKHPPVFHEVVRNKAARAKMDAVTCAQCRGFFDAAGGVLPSDTVLRCHHDHSRHRVAPKATPQTETPESFWQIGFTDTDREETQAKSACSLFDACLAVDRARGQRLASRTYGRNTRGGRPRDA